MPTYTPSTVVITRPFFRSGHQSMASRLANVDPLLTYGASKAALESITRSLANMLGLKTGATFNSVNMGATRSGASLAAAGAFGQVFVDEAVKANTTEQLS